MCKDNKNPESIIVNENVSAEDLGVFSIYFDKQKMIHEDIRAWTKTCITINSSLFVGLAFLLEYKTGIDDITLFLLIVISLLGIFFSGIWSKVHGDLTNWQLRSYAILANVEAKILKSGLVLARDSNRDEKDLRSESLKRCGMWNMINTFRLYKVPRSQKEDTMDVLKKVPGMFMGIWTFILLAVVLIYLKYM